MSGEWDCQLFMMDSGGWHVASCGHLGADDTDPDEDAVVGRFLQASSEHGDDLSECVRTATLVMGLTPVAVYQVFEGGVFVKCVYGIHEWGTITGGVNGKKDETIIITNPDNKAGAA